MYPQHPKHARRGCECEREPALFKFSGMMPVFSFLTKGMSWCKLALRSKLNKLSWQFSHIYSKASIKQRRLDWQKLWLAKVKVIKIRRITRPRRFRLSNSVKKSEMLTPTSERHCQQSRNFISTFYSWEWRRWFGWAFHHEKGWSCKRCTASQTWSSKCKHATLPWTPACCCP